MWKVCRFLAVSESKKKNQNAEESKLKSNLKNMILNKNKANTLGDDLDELLTEDKRLEINKNDLNKMRSGHYSSHVERMYKQLFQKFI